MGLYKTVAIGAGLSVVLGVGMGVAAESHTNEVAEGKVVTIDTCRSIHPSSTTIGEGVLACMSEGVPGGNDIGNDKFEVGDPIAYLDAYRQSLINEAESIEAGRLVIWSAVPATVAAVAIAAALYF